VDHHAQRTQEWKESNPLKRRRVAGRLSTKQVAEILGITNVQVLELEAGASPTDAEMMMVTRGSGLTKTQWSAWERAMPCGPEPEASPASPILDARRRDVTQASTQ
jgi:hypothetical protein